MEGIPHLVPLIAFIVASALTILHLKVKIGKKRFLIDYGTAPLIGMLILLLALSLQWSGVYGGIVGTETIKPYSIIILFMSLAYICISLDFTGFYKYVSIKVAEAAETHGYQLFLYSFLLSTVFTIFTSNDIVILTLTPIVFYFAAHAKINPIPLLISEFFAANIWSSTLYIGNPTNIIVADAFAVNFIEYSRWTVLPTISAGLVSLIIMFFYFRKSIKRKIKPMNIDPRSVLKEPKGAAFGLVCLASCLALLSISPLLGLEVWVITLSFALLVFSKDAVSGRLSGIHRVQTVVKRMPWKIVPFISGMFILVNHLYISGWVGLFATALASVSTEVFSSVILMNFLSSFACNIMNNQPMTILFTHIISDPAFAVTPIIEKGVMYALILGSNLGANITPIGALAGIMWAHILRHSGVKITFREFCKYGLIVMPPVILVSSIVLALELILW